MMTRTAMASGNPASAPHVQERRAHERYEYGFGARVHTERGLIPASTKDISRGGCQLVSDRPLRDGERVRLELCLTIEGFQIEDAPTLEVEANVQWSAEGMEFGEAVHFAGAEFHAMPPDTAQWLEDMLRTGQAPDVDESIDIDLDF